MIVFPSNSTPTSVIGIHVHGDDGRLTRIEWVINSRGPCSVGWPVGQVGQAVLAHIEWRSCQGNRFEWMGPMDDDLTWDIRGVRRNYQGMTLLES